MLTVAGRERGSVVVETVAAVVVLLFLVLGTIEVAFALYARNVVGAAAHEGARAAAQRGSEHGEASTVARDAVVRAAGGLVRDIRVETAVTAVGERSLVRVRVAGVIRAFGPVPLPIPLRSTATVTREVDVR